ncbi:FAD-dependent oxidoreductase [Schizosaccharomyces japonicus yFS275]|uniref:FAD-dependent oxidoreductase n=1 Tax=Schizosaccharomyces japonicus (strain yFS275 / FY16936) TaxID=402676 RepID=B6JV81_SCHJY|nr:FAD-dependent oxidoreductase [Schizosaccharomyces japonicus yFS275]EEB05282.1 FAD-dependent oxidoreductase [Schizosaccharomyces japonicus yFS275]
MNRGNRNIVIIGGGITGVCCAYYIANHEKFNRSRDSITLFESSGIASAASGKASGFLSLEWHGPATSSLAKLSYNLHRELAEKYDGAKQWGYRALDTWSVKIDEHCKEPDHLPESIEWIDSNIVEKVTRLGTKKDTGQVHPYKFCHFLVKETSKIADFTIIKGHVTNVEENEVEYRLLEEEPYEPDEDDEISDEAELHTLHSMEATDVIVATGPWTPRLLPELRISGARIHSILVDLPFKLSGNAAFTEITFEDGTTAAPEFYAREDEMYICGEFDDEPLPELSSETKVNDEKCKWIKSCADHYHECFRQSDIKLRQACYLPISNTTGAPMLGKMTDSVYVAAAHGCWGITLGPGTGKVMAELVLDGEVKSASIDLLDPKYCM